MGLTKPATYGILSSTLARFDVILPAGGRIKPEFAEKVGTDVKALIEFEGRTILERTLEALIGTDRVDRLIVIGSKPVQESEAAALATEVLEEVGSGPDNILHGLVRLSELSNPPEKVLILTTDMPFLTSKMINDFIDACPDNAEICVPLVSRGQWNERFPNSTATFIKVRGDELTAGCMYMFDVAAFKKALPHIEEVFKNRKSKVGMVRLLGPKFLLKFATGTLQVRDVEKKVKDMLGIEGAAIPNSAPELAYDIDDIDDYDYAMRNLVHANP